MEGAVAGWDADYHGGLLGCRGGGLGRCETCPYGGWGIGGVADKALGLFLHRRGWGEWREITNETS